MISIIVPCYNAGNKIEKCLDSLRNQTSYDFEVIFVDDCSKDNTVSILNEYKDSVKFNVIICENKDNRGPGYCRNKGLDVAKGEFILFVDSDDYLSNNCIELIEMNENIELDFIVFDYNRVVKDKIFKKVLLNYSSGNLKNDILISGRQEVWGKVYKKEIITKYNIKFPDIRLNEDMPFLKSYILRCYKGLYLHSNLYYYVDNCDSIMKSKNAWNIEDEKEGYHTLYENINSMVEAEVLEIIKYREMYSVIQKMFYNHYKKREIRTYYLSSYDAINKIKDNRYLTFLPKHIKICIWAIKNDFYFVQMMIYVIKKISG